MEIGMEQALEDRFGNLMNGNIRVLPSVHNGLDCVGLWRYQLIITLQAEGHETPYHNDFGNVPSWLVN